MSSSFVIPTALRPPQIRQLATVLGVRKEAAAAGRLRPVGEAEALGQFELRLAAAALEAEQLLPTHPTLRSGMVGARLRAHSGRSSRSSAPDSRAMTGMVALALALGALPMTSPVTMKSNPSPA